MWTRAGVRTTVEAQPWTTFIGRAARQDLPRFLVGWGTSSGEASNPLRNLVATVDRDKGYGASNRGRYSNPEVDRVLDAAMRELDDAKREALLQQATRLAFERCRHPAAAHPEERLGDAARLGHDAAGR